MNLVLQSIFKDLIVKLFWFRSVSLGFVSFRFVEYNKPRQEGLEIFLWPKYISFLVDDPPGKAASKISHDQLDLSRSDNKFFSRHDLAMSKVR